MKKDPLRNLRSVLGRLQFSEIAGAFYRHRAFCIDRIGLLRNEVSGDVVVEVGVWIPEFGPLSERSIKLHNLNFRRLFGYLGDAHNIHSFAKRFDPQRSVEVRRLAGDLRSVIDPWLLSMASHKDVLSMLNLMEDIELRPGGTAGARRKSDGVGTFGLDITRPAGTFNFFDVSRMVGATLPNVIAAEGFSVRPIKESTLKRAARDAIYTQFQRRLGRVEHSILFKSVYGQWCEVTVTARDVSTGAENVQYVHAKGPLSQRHYSWAVRDAQSVQRFRVEVSRALTTKALPFFSSLATSEALEKYLWQF